MNSIQLKMVGAGFVFLFIFLSGFWLSRNGSPYGTGLLIVHKLLSLAVFFIGTILAGGLLSTDLELPTAVRILHHITPWLTMAATVGTLYLLLNHSQQLAQ